MTPLEFAISQIGVEEVPRGSNWGDKVKEYLKSVGVGFPASWCAAFVYWCHKQSDATTKLPRTGGVLAMWNKTPVANRVKDPQAGDIFIMDFGQGLGHTGIVESVDGYTVHTIEGNTNDTGGREGYEVCRKSRAISKMKGFIRF